MKKIVLATLVSLAAATGIASTAGAATTVNVGGVANASLNGSNAVSTTLAAGTYKLTFVADAFIAFTRFSGISGCDAFGANCTQGFENSARYVIGAQTFGFGDGGAGGGIGPVTGGAYYNSAVNSLANAGKYSALFTLGTAQSVKFYLVDDNLGDNSGGVSLAITAVPEPAAWGLMIVGFGAIGGAMRRRAKVRTNLAFS